MYLAADAPEERSLLALLADTLYFGLPRQVISTVIPDGLQSSAGQPASRGLLCGSEAAQPGRGLTLGDNSARWRSMLLYCKGDQPPNELQHRDLADLLLCPLLLADVVPLLPQLVHLGLGDLFLLYVGLHLLLLLILLLLLLGELVLSLHLCSVQAPSLHHAHVQKPEVDPPVPLLESYGDGMVLLCTVQEIHTPDECVVIVVDAGLGHFRLAFFLHAVVLAAAHGL